MLLACTHAARPVLALTCCPRTLPKRLSVGPQPPSAAPSPGHPNAKDPLERIQGGLCHAARGTRHCRRRATPQATWGGRYLWKPPLTTRFSPPREAAASPVRPSRSNVCRCCVFAYIRHLTPLIVINVESTVENCNINSGFTNVSRNPDLRRVPGPFWPFQACGAAAVDLQRRIYSGKPTGCLIQGAPHPAAAP